MQSSSDWSKLHRRTAEEFRSFLELRANPRLIFTDIEYFERCEADTLLKFIKKHQGIDVWKCVPVEFVQIQIGILFWDSEVAHRLCLASSWNWSEANCRYVVAACSLVISDLRMKIWGSQSRATKSRSWNSKIQIAPAILVILGWSFAGNKHRNYCEMWIQ